MQPDTEDKTEPTLAQRLERVAAIKHSMAGLLHELEEQATGQKVSKPGAWRHHPKDWVEQHPRSGEPT